MPPTIAVTSLIQSADRSRRIRTVLWVVLALNIAVALAKLFYGIISHSAAMEADGFHSLFDGASNIIGLVGMWFASRPADEGHPGSGHPVEGAALREVPGHDEAILPD